MSDTVAAARRVAFDVLKAVSLGGRAADLLFETGGALEARDAALAEEIVMGVLRRQCQMDFLIRHYSGRDPRSLDLEVVLALRMGIYQLRNLDRIPPHAAVGESVALVKRAGKGYAAGLVNAVLRKVTRLPIPWPDRATRLGLPPWILERWDGQYGAETTERMALACLETPECYIRAPEGVRQEDAGKVRPTSVAGCYCWEDGRPEGFRMMDAGAQTIAPLLDLAPEHSVLDVCAAPGNKTRQILETSRNVVAADHSWRRLRELRDLPAMRIVLDAQRSLPFGRVFDRILVDAPCSGTGTLRRNPEIKWRLRPADLRRHQQRQVNILRQALSVLKPGGRLVYATCSLEREENEGVLELVREAVVARTVKRLPGRDEGDGFFAAVITSN